MHDPKGDQAKLTAGKIQKLTKYVNELKGKLAGNIVGSKYKDTPEEYKRYLRREIEMHSKKIENLSK